MYVFTLVSNVFHDIDIVGSEKTLVLIFYHSFSFFRVHMLEEHIREIELQSQERLIEEQKRHKELVQRLEVCPCAFIQSLSVILS